MVTLIIGLFIGGSVGFLIASLIVVSRKSEEVIPKASNALPASHEWELI